MDAATPHIALQRSHLGLIAILGEGYLQFVTVALDITGLGGTGLALDGVGLGHRLQLDDMAADGQSAPGPVVDRASAADRPGSLQTDRRQGGRTERKRAGGMGGLPLVA